MQPFTKSVAADVRRRSLSQKLVRRGTRLITRAVGLCALAATAQIAAQADWVPIGPRGDIGGQSVAGPGVRDRANGRIASIQVVAGVAGHYYLYVGASSGGIWRADRTPETPLVWTDLGKKLPNPSVGAFVTDSSNPDDILVGTGEWQRYNGAGMFHTTDGGASWGKVPLPSTPVSFFRMAYSLNSLDVVFAASSAGLFRSEHGPTGPWQTVLSGFVSDLTLHPSDPNVLFACLGNGGFGGLGPAGNGVYKSTDAGQTWTLMTHLDPFLCYRASLTICRNSPDVMALVWAGKDRNGINIQAVMKSPDGGNNWSDISGINAGAGSGQSFHVLSIAIAPDNPDELYVGSSGLQVTLDGGMTWTGNPNGYAIEGHEDNSQLYFSPRDDRTLWICNDGGVYAYTRGDDHSVSFNGDNVNGLQVSQITGIDAKLNLRFAVMQDNGVNGSMDRGATWKQFHAADGYAVTISRPYDQDPGFWYLKWSGGPPETLYRETFSGSPVQFLDSSWGNPYYDRSTDRVFVFMLDTVSTPQKTDVFSLPALANGWNDAQLETSVTALFAGITGSYLDGQTIYLWLTDFESVPTANKYNLAVLRRSGQSWIVTTTLVGVPGQTNPIQRVVASRKWSGEAWALLNASPTNQVFHSTDYGASWTDITGDLEQSTILFEGFEGNFPTDNGWIVGDDSPDGTTASWAKVNSSFGGEGTHSGAWKGYCAGSAYPFNSSEPNPVYQDSMIAFMQRSVNLAGLTKAELRFWYKIPSIEQCNDLARVLVDGTNLVWSAWVWPATRHGKHHCRFAFRLQ